MKKIVVDKDRCIGCGTCVALAAKSFKMGDDGKSHIIQPPQDSQQTIQNAVDSCPVSAISWVEE